MPVTICGALPISTDPVVLAARPPKEPRRQCLIIHSGQSRMALT